MKKKNANFPSFSFFFLVKNIFKICLYVCSKPSINNTFHLLWNCLGSLISLAYSTTSVNVYLKIFYNDRAKKDAVQPSSLYFSIASFRMKSLFIKHVDLNKRKKDFQHQFLFCCFFSTLFLFSFLHM